MEKKEYIYVQPRLFNNRYIVLTASQLSELQQLNFTARLPDASSEHVAFFNIVFFSIAIA